jgi:Family of unknown function (DUF5990)
VERELTLRIVLQKPPKGVDFSLQKGRGSIYETVQKQRSKGGDLQFKFTVRVEGGNNDAPPSLLGPFVQGPAGARFVYIDIGTLAGQADSCWTRRLKVPLSGITMKMVRAGGVLQTHVPGTGPDGGPACATVKEFEGWKAV